MTEEKYEIKMVPENAGLTISTATEPKVVVTITLTSPVMREGPDTGNGNHTFCLGVGITKESASKLLSRGTSI